MCKWLFAISLVLSVPAMAQPAAAPTRAPAPRPPATEKGAIATTTPGLLCFTGCPSTSMMLLFINSEGRCTVPVRFSCFPYKCDPSVRACKTGCVSSSDCAAGAICNLAQSVCAPVSYQCADGWTIQSSDGTATSCSPYRCEGGACKSTCSANMDCADPAKCTGGICLDPKKK